MRQHDEVGPVRGRRLGHGVGAVCVARRDRGGVGTEHPEVHVAQLPGGARRGRRGGGVAAAGGVVAAVEQPAGGDAVHLNVEEALAAAVLGGAAEPRQVSARERVEGAVVAERPVAAEGSHSAADDASDLQADEATRGSGHAHAPGWAALRVGHPQRQHTYARGDHRAFPGIRCRLHFAADRRAGLEHAGGRQRRPSAEHHDGRHQGRARAPRQQPRVPRQMPAPAHGLAQRSLDVVEVVAHLSSSCDLKRRRPRLTCCLTTSCEHRSSAASSS